MYIIFSLFLWGFKGMQSQDLQKLKERLDALLEEMPLDSEEILILSHQIDFLVVEYYHNSLRN